MKIGIVGLPRSGKTTIFNAVTRGSAQVGAYTDRQGNPNLGVAKVPDPILDRLQDIFSAKRKVAAEVTYVDVPGAPEGVGKTRGVSGENLNHLQTTDAILIVARAFEDPSVTHVDESVDGFRDVENMLLELTVADSEILERRLQRLEEGFKGARAPERDALSREQALMGRLKADLEGLTPIRDHALSGDEARQLEGFQFLTAKPLIVALNVGEDQMSEVTLLEERLSSSFGGPGVKTTALCGKLEMELAQMEPEEELEFRESLGVGESGLERMLGVSYEALDNITFYTGNRNEVHAWPIARDMTALKAAGKVHSDFERGFIRSEVVAAGDLVACGSMAEARKRGLLRREGKGYEVCDGDVINILFSV